jgi:hypothetical protein
LNIWSKVLISWAFVVVGTGGLVGGGVVWVIVWVVVVMAFWVTRSLPNVWVGEVLIGLFRMSMLVWSCSSWLLSSTCSHASSSSTVCKASSTCCYAEVSRASCNVLRLRVLASMVPSSLSYLCTSGMGSPSIGSLSLLDSLCQTLYLNSTGMAPLVLSLPFGQYVWNVFPVLFDRWFLSIRTTLEFGFVSSISLSDRYNGGRPMLSAILEESWI